MLVAHERANRHARLVGTHVKEFRREMYRFAVAHLAAMKDHNNELVAMIASEGKTVSQWMDAKFELFEEMNDTRERLFSAIEAGVSEREYVAEAHVTVNRKRVAADALTAKDDGVIPQPSSGTMTPEERADEFRDLFESMKSKYQAVRHELRVTRQEFGRAEVRIRRLERTINRLKKDIESLYEQPADAKH